MTRVRKPPALRVAERQLAEALYAIRQHRKHCSRCNVALQADLPGRTCDTGWAYLKLERAAAKAVRLEQDRQGALSDRQLALW